jgi:outer membrane protein TolC
MLAQARGWTLDTIVDIALRNSSQTKAAWAAARSAAAAYGSRRGDYLPDIGVGGFATAQQSTGPGGTSTFRTRPYGATADLSWLLFNFGGREAAVAEARQALYAADWLHNAAIQNVMLAVEQAYYQYLTVKALSAAQTSTMKDAQANLDAAEDRHDAGLATIADVLQARTAMSQAQLALEGLLGQIAITRGALATAMGLPANLDFDIELPSQELQLQETTDSVDVFLDRAQRARPDLAAARAGAERARAHVGKVKADGYPNITANGNLGRTYYMDRDEFRDTYLATVQVHLPVFTGFSHRYDVQQAHADADWAAANLETARQAVVLQVWTSYYDLKTAEQRVRTSGELLKSATESHDVARGRYKSGVGSILDLLAAQAALEGARAQRIEAWSDWFTAVARLAHDTGTLGLADSEKEGMR